MVNKIVNGIVAELIVSLVLFPLNTWKVHRQIGKKIKIGNVYNGIKWCLANELLDAAVFFSVREKTGNVGMASFVSNVVSYPVYLRTKLRQSGKPLNGNFTGFPESTMVSLPTTVLVYHLQKCINEKAPSLANGTSGFLASVGALFITHPLSTLSILRQTGSPLTKTVVCNMTSLYSGLGVRLLEQSLAIGSKLLIMDKLNKIK